MEDQVYPHLDRAWKSTCRVLFGQEVGALADFEPWLREYLDPPRRARSSLSGKEISFASKDYAKGARFASFDEIDFGRQFEPLSINEVKDLDGLTAALGERITYIGNVVLGNSHFVAGSSDVINGNYVLNSEVVNDSKFVSDCEYVSDSEYCFGIIGTHLSTHAIKCSGSQMTRCFECHSAELLADCYYSASIKNCQHCLFSFGAENRHNLIGNLELTQAQFATLKTKLLGELAEQLRKEKRAFSLFALLERAAKKAGAPKKTLPAELEPAFDLQPLETAFRTTTRIMFGRDLRGLEAYGPYLQSHVPKNEYYYSPWSGTPVIAAGYRRHIPHLFDLSQRLLTENENRHNGTRPLDAKTVSGLTVDLDRLAAALAPIAYADLNKVYGNNRNIRHCGVVRNAQDCLEGSAYLESKRCAYCFWPLGSENVFGSSTTWESAYCIKCYNSKRLTRCFEVDSSNNCADGYFLHNCEGVGQSMFCFNVKNKQHAIGNAELGREKYSGVKQALVAQMADELERKKKLELSIFNLG